MKFRVHGLIWILLDFVNGIDRLENIRSVTTITIFEPLFGHVFTDTRSIVLAFEVHRFRTYFFLVRG